MTALTVNCDAHSRRTRKDGPADHTDLTSCKVWQIVQSVNLIDAFKTPLFAHGKSAARSLLGWLKKQHDSLVTRYVLPLFYNNRGGSQQHGHVSIMAAHVRIAGDSFVLEVLIMLWHGQCVHVRSDGDADCFS